MLLEKKHLVRGQQILTHLGYYKGKIDGTWGPASIAAKKEFECSGKFSPGIPNNGLPFNAEPPYAKGLIMMGGVLSIVGVKDDDLPSVDAEPVPTPAPTPAPNQQVSNHNHNRNRKKNRGNRPNQSNQQGQQNQANQSESAASSLGDLNIKTETMGDGQ